MPTPTVITDLSQTAASNYPAGTDSPSVLDDVQRAHAAFIALLRDGKGQSSVQTIAGGGTTDIGGVNSQFVEVTGTPIITSFGTNYTGVRFVRFTGAATITHNGTLINLPGAANITTASGDSLIAVPNSTGNGWNVASFMRASALPAVVGGDIGAATATTAAPSDSSTKVATTAFVNANTGKQLQTIGASVAANALTISASDLSLDFRSTTLGSGVVTRVSGTPANTVISSGSTGGTINGVQSDIVVLALNNAGTIELAWTNFAGGVNLDETGLISTTAEGGAGAADSANVVYSTTARTNVAYRVIGLIRSTQATAGAWATAPSKIQGQGGQALAAMSSLGYGQTWQVVTGSRVNGTTYYNTTGKPIQVQVYWRRGANTFGYISITSIVNGVTVDSNVSYFDTTDESANTPCFTVPVGGSYSVTQSGLPNTMVWNELR